MIDARFPLGRSDLSPPFRRKYPPSRPWSFHRLFSFRSYANGSCCSSSSGPPFFNLPSLSGEEIPCANAKSKVLSSILVGFALCHLFSPIPREFLKGHRRSSFSLRLFSLQALNSNVIGTAFTSDSMFFLSVVASFFVSRFFRCVFRSVGRRRGVLSLLFSLARVHSPRD